MKIINKTKNTVLAENVILADTALKRLRGLLHRGQLDPGEALVLRPCNSVHMFFMRFAIDVLFVDKQNRVVKTITRLKPFRISAIYWRSSFAVELPAGTIQATSTMPGDCLEIK
jgi:uncharacterized membrane protein (UPF0127 family)